jgi:lipoprotein signal peptidase
LTTQQFIGRLTAVTVGAGAADQATKLLVSAAVPAANHLRLALGIQLVHVQRASFRSTTLTVILTVVLVISALAGWSWQARRPKSLRRTWLAGGLLVGGAASSFLERAISGSTTEWLSLPFGPAISLAYIEMLAGASALFFVLGASRHRLRRRAASTSHERR